MAASRPIQSKPGKSRAGILDRLKAVNLKKAAMLGGALLFALIMYLGLQPIVGTPAFGVCKIYVELQTTYPIELRYTSLEEGQTQRDGVPGGTVRMDYVQINEFGDYASKTTVCNYRIDPVAGMRLTGVITNRQPEPKDRVERFNLTIPAILANPPPLNTPGVMPRDLQALWRPH